MARRPKAIDVADIPLNELPLPVVASAHDARALYEWLSNAVGRLRRVPYQPAEWMERAAWYWSGQKPSFAQESEALIRAANAWLDAHEYHRRPAFTDAQAVDLDKQLSKLLRYVATIGTSNLSPLERETALASLRETSSSAHDDQAKGTPGRRGYPVEALEYAKELRERNPRMKAVWLRNQCLKKFHKDDLPPHADSFRAWMNRKRTNRTN
jgi:hypothetical protein